MADARAVQVIGVTGTSANDSADISKLLHECPIATEGIGANNGKEYMMQRPTGVYSVIRASGVPSATQYAIIGSDFQWNRLATGLETVLQHDRVDVDENVKQNLLHGLQHATHSLCSRLLESYEQHGITPSASKVDVILYTLWWRTPEQPSASYNISVYASTAPRKQTLPSPDNALIYGHGRENAICKHTKWILDREHLDQHKALFSAKVAPLREVILYSAIDNDKFLLEGLVSNFFIVQDGQVFTAKEDVLLGSMRHLVLQACEKLSISVVEECPRWSNRHKWQAAFTTNAVQVMTPIESVYWEDESADLDTSSGVHSVHLHDPDKIIHRLWECILESNYFL